MTRPQISVVMSVYNGAGYLAESIDSILIQEGADFEFIIVNDGSSDESPHLLDQYAAQDSRLRVIHQENQGLTRALIRGCAEARGELIARQDVGDRSEAGRLADQAAALDADPQTVFSSCWTRVEGPAGEFLHEVRGSGYASDPAWVLNPEAQWGMLDGPTWHPSVMFRRDAYEQAGGYRAAFRVGQDWDLWYRLATLGRFQMLQQPLYSARIDYGGISATRSAEQARFAMLSLEAMRLRARGQSDADVLARAAAIQPDPVRATLRAQRARISYFVGEGLRKNGDRRAMRYLVDAVRQGPLKLKHWVRLLQGSALLLRHPPTRASRSQ